MKFLLAIPLAAAFLASVAHADPDDYVHVPAVEYGEREIDFKFGSARGGADGNLTAASLGFGYGVTQWWFTEFYAKVQRPDGSSTHFDAFEWENKLQLTEPGEYWADLGFLLEIERPKDRTEGYEVRLGPLLQKNIGRLQTNVNFLITRHYRADEPEVTELGYEWQLRYRWRPELDFGAQGFGEVGRWNHWDPASEQRHIAGPAVFGKFSLGGRQVIQYNAAWLFKVAGDSPSNTFRLQTEFEF